MEGIAVLEESDRFLLLEKHMHTCKLNLRSRNVVNLIHVMKIQCKHEKAMTKREGKNKDDCLRHHHAEFQLTCAVFSQHSPGASQAHTVFHWTRRSFPQDPWEGCDTVPNSIQVSIGSLSNSRLQ